MSDQFGLLNSFKGVRIIFNGSAEKVFLNFIAAGYEAFVLNSDYEWDHVNKLNEHTDYLFVPISPSTQVASMEI